VAGAVGLRRRRLRVQGTRLLDAGPVGVAEPRRALRPPLARPAVAQPEVRLAADSVARVVVAAVALLVQQVAEPLAAALVDR
jgi:hypothetical protein